MSMIYISIKWQHLEWHYTTMNGLFTVMGMTAMENKQQTIRGAPITSTKCIALPNIHGLELIFLHRITHAMQ